MVTEEVIDAGAVERLLRDLGYRATDVEPIGAGAWSRAFGFRTEDGERVIRVGEYVDDFEKDRLAFRYCSYDLPVPEVHAIGAAFGAHYVISTRVAGGPLEQSPATDWPALAPAVVRVLAALRDAEPIGRNFGGWDATGDATHSSWRAFLRAVESDPPTSRLHGWSQRLRGSEGGDAAFIRWLQVLDQVAIDDVPRSLIHGDLINRNVHVRDSGVTGVFDWGCSAYGDHLYDLAWFEFWSPWHPNLDLAPLQATMGAARGGHVEQRYLACLLAIGLDHIAYNAHLDDWTEVANVERRLDEVCRQFR